MHWALPPFLFLVWIVGTLVAVMERAVTGPPGGVSIFPSLPLFPLIAWGFSALLDHIYHDLGLVFVGGLHALVLIYLIIRGLYLCSVLRRRD